VPGTGANFFASPRKLIRDLFERNQLASISRGVSFDHEATRPGKLVDMDAQSLFFPDAYFEFAYSFHALGHIPDGERVLSEMDRVLPPGCAFCIGTPNKARIIAYDFGQKPTVAHD
jgi:ubiquinone/menaquinone biosynthesis C-methylase UbiE